jgi:hypothetical protein
MMIGLIQGRPAILATHDNPSLLAAAPPSMGAKPE